MTERPTIVCLCGSTRFKETFDQVAADETLAGRIVLTVNDFNVARRPQNQFTGDSHHPPDAEKQALDELHLRKIDLADEVLILNVGGYIGSSTSNELRYAREHGKRIRFLEQRRFPAVPADREQALLAEGRSWTYEQAQAALRRMGRSA